MTTGKYLHLRNILFSSEMKTISKITFPILMALAAGSYAQTGSPSTINLKNLQVPSSPAFILMDVAPTSIEKPATAKAFSASILNSVSENNGIPENYGVEFTPFWFVKHPKFTAYKYYGIDPSGKKRMPFAGLRMTAISLASVRNETAIDTVFLKTSNIAIGVRSTLVKVISNSDIRDIVYYHDSLSRLIEGLNLQLGMTDSKVAFFESMLEQIQKELDSSPPDSVIAILKKKKQDAEETLKELKAEYLELLNNGSRDPRMVAVENKLKEILARKPIFAVDGAMALNWAFENSRFDDNYFDRFGAWLSMNLSLPLHKRDASSKTNYFNLYAVGRYLTGRTLEEIYSADRQSVFDAGGKAEAEIGPFSLSAEYIYRANLDDPGENTFRACGVAKYKIFESLYLTGSFGKNFGDQNNLISLFGINWGFGSGFESVSN